MSSLLDDVNQRTQLAGYNRLEILMFRLGGKQRYGINVFKVQEVIQCPPLTKLPNANPVVRGIVNIRGKTLSVIDLAMAIGKRPLADEKNCFLVVAEYNRVTQGFLVSGMDRIVNMNWEEIKPPPKGMGSGCYLTAITSVDDEFVEIIDVEKVLADVIGMQMDVSQDKIEEGRNFNLTEKFMLVVDDSVVARKQIQRTLDQLGVASVVAKNGREGLDLLQGWADNEPDKIENHLMMVISDVEMPEMDGYTLTTEIRKDPRLASLYIVLHTSLSGVFNTAMVEKVGANAFISKYDPDILGAAVLGQIKRFSDTHDTTA
ncbi:MAG: chemotaxis protein CheV [Gammaproteobacteria bacterium]|nr:chemotaxis protein CheV [Gammaproteobacteria bacterium]